VYIKSPFQDLFTPIVWVLFTFPSRYFSTIGVCLLQSFEDGSPFFKQIFSVLLIDFFHILTGLSPSLAKVSTFLKTLDSKKYALFGFVRHYFRILG